MHDGIFPEPEELVSVGLCGAVAVLAFVFLVALVIH